MHRYKVCVYAITKNEEQFVDRWMDAVSEADEVIVADTGSTDHTVERLRERGATLYEERIEPWRFDAARNIAMDHLPEDTDICVCCDLDEVFEAGWRERLESAWNPEHTRARYSFVWSHHPDGTPDLIYPMEKIHRRYGFRWVHPVHEVLHYSGTDPDQTVNINDLVLHHYPDLSKPRGQYLPLLELSAAENPTDSQTIFWLGREYLYNGLYDKSIAALKRYLALPGAQWAEERAAAMRFLSQCYEQKSDRRRAKSWAYRAVAECPYVREGYLALARLGYQEENWPLCYAMAENGLAIVQRSGSYLTQSDAWGAALYDYGAIAAYRLGIFKKARSYAAIACALEPKNERLKANLTAIEQALSARAEKEE